MDTKLNRLQLIQNHAARIITRTKKFDHISGVLHPELSGCITTLTVVIHPEDSSL